MANQRTGGSAWRSARFPAILLILYLALLAGVLTWLTITSPPAAIATGAKPPTVTGGSDGAKPAGKSPRDAGTAVKHGAPAVAATDHAQPGAKPVLPQPGPPTIAATAPHPVDTAPAQHPPAAAPAPAPAPDATSGDSDSAAARKPAGIANTAKAGMTRPETEKPATESAPPAAAVPPPAPKLAAAANGPPLPAAPDPALIQRTPNGLLPIVGADGREAWRVYARPFDAKDRRPRIAIVIYGLGISAAATEAAIQGLPGAVTLAFSPYGDGLDGWIGKARAAGHEVMLMAPMEPDNFPVFDPGPRGLLTSLQPTQNVERLEWMLSRATGTIGVVSYLGSRFTASRRHMTPILRELKRRGLMYLESHGGGVPVEVANRVGVPFTTSAFFIDDRAAREAIDRRLAELERLARRNGRAAALGYSYPVTLERVAAWAQTIGEKGLVLAPVSALASRIEPR